MKLSKGGLVVVVTVVALSAFVANVAQLIAVETFEGNLESNRRFDGEIEIGESEKRLLWFVQISDLHLSIFSDPARTTEFKDFCENTLKIIKPTVVLATGDLTDAKARDDVGSKQFEQEWKKYSKILNSCSQLKSSMWLDIRGNHDNFDVPGVYSERNYFRKYSIQGKHHPKSYEYVFKKDNVSYSFVGIDACPDQGLKRPFNFVGILRENDLDEIRLLAASANKSDHTIWFGHYPTSCIWSHYPGVRSIIGSVKGSLAYLCGHFHSLLGLIPKMYTIQRQGFYELELADWKDNRMFRLLAIDHGLFSFVDIKYNDWPVVLVTNPKDSLFQLFSKEPLQSIKTSSHIRILVFSPYKILSVMVRIDENNWESCLETRNKNLFVLKWEPQKLSDKTHDIEVSVLDEGGQKKTIKQNFSLEGTSNAFPVLARMILMLNFGSTLQLLFGLATISSVLPLCTLRYLNKTIDEKNSFSSLRAGTIKNWMRRFWILSSVDRLFFPIVFYPLYVAIGPWCMGELIEGFTGVIFIWGIFINGTFLPGSFTYGYGFLQLIVFQGPLIVFTAYALDQRLYGTRTVRHSKIIKYSLYCIESLPFLLIFMSQIMMTYTFWLAYGTMSILFGPVRLWPILLTVWAWYYSSSIPLSQMKNAANLWAKFIDRSSPIFLK